MNRFCQIKVGPLHCIVLEQNGNVSFEVNAYSIKFYVNVPKEFFKKSLNLPRRKPICWLPASLLVIGTSIGTGTAPAITHLEKYVEVVFKH